MDKEVCYIEVTLNHASDATRACAVLKVGDRRFRGYGQAHRNPTDPDVPRIGEELAISRMLSELSHQLLQAAADAIRTFESHPIIVH